MADIKPLSESYGTETVRLFVGAKRKKYVFHKLLLCQHSPYFDRMFKNSGFIEARDQECFLEQDHGDAFELLAHFIYTEHVPTDCRSVTGGNYFYLPFIRFYVLADKILLASEVKTKIIDALIAAKTTYGGYLLKETVNFTLTSTAEDCPMRRVVVDLMCRDLVRQGTAGAVGRYLEGCLGDVPLAQVIQIFTTLWQGMSWFQPGVVGEALNKASTRSVAAVPRYKIGYLQPS